VNPNLKRIWNDTPPRVSGSIVLIALLGLLAVVIFSGPNPRTLLPKLVAASIGGVVACKVFITGRLVLDKQRVVTGWLAKMIGIVGTVLLLVSGYFSVILIYNRLVE
jgi:hypothetical protein